MKVRLFFLINAVEKKYIFETEMKVNLSQDAIT